MVADFNLAMPEQLRELKEKEAVISE